MRPELTPQLFRVVVEGTGGQGVLLLAQLIGQVLITRFRKVTVSPSYTAEMFGGPCHSFVVASNGDVPLPIPEQAELAISFDGATGRLRRALLAPGAPVLEARASGRQKDIVLVTPSEERTLLSLPATRQTRVNLELFAAFCSVFGVEQELAVASLRAQSGRKLDEAKEALLVASLDRILENGIAREATCVSA